MENPKELFDSLIQTAVSEALLADAIELYADQEIPNDNERDEFIEKYSDDVYQPIVRKAVLDVVVAIVSAYRIKEEDAFHIVVDMLDVEEQDEVVQQMKLVMLRKMTDDAVADMAEPEELRFRARMSYVERSIG